MAIDLPTLPSSLTEEEINEIKHNFEAQFLVRDFMFNDTKFAIILCADFDKVDFSQIEQTSTDTVRKNSDKTRGLIKWTTPQEPSFLQELSYYEGPYSIRDIDHILQNIDWAHDVSDDDL